MAGLTWEIRDRSDNLIAEFTSRAPLRALLRFFDAQGINPNTYAVVALDREGMPTRLSTEEV